MCPSSEAVEGAVKHFPITCYWLRDVGVRIYHLCSTIKIFVYV